jgi:hypothetical protein
LVSANFEGYFNDGLTQCLKQCGRGSKGFKAGFKTCRETLSDTLQIQSLVDDHLVERVVDVLGPRIVAQNPPRSTEDLREAPQGPHAGALEEIPEFLPEELPPASSTGVRVKDRRAISVSAGSHEGHHDRYFDHGEAPPRPAELRAPAVPNPCSIAWDLGQFSSDLSAITKEMELSTFIFMALVVGARHALSPEAKKKLVIGGKLQLRPKSRRRGTV